MPTTSPADAYIALGDALRAVRGAAERLLDAGETFAYMDVTSHLRQLEHAREIKLAVLAREAAGESPWRLPGLHPASRMPEAHRRRAGLAAALRDLETAHAHLLDAARVDKAGAPAEAETISQLAARLRGLAGEIRGVTVPDAHQRSA